MIVIIGTGAVAAEITLFFPVVKGYLEYSSNIDKYYNHYNLKRPVLGDIDSYSIQPSDSFILAFADIEFRKKMTAKIKSRGGALLNHIHPSVIVSPDFVMGEGNVIYPQCIISTNVKIGSYNLLTCQSILSHDCEIQDNNVLATTLLCGHVKAGSNNSFGIKSTAIPHVTIGDGNTIQAGMIIDKNIENNTTIFHKFKEKVYYTKYADQYT